MGLKSGMGRRFPPVHSVEDPPEAGAESKG